MVLVLPQMEKVVERVVLYGLMLILFLEMGLFLLTVAMLTVMHLGQEVVVVGALLCMWERILIQEWLLLMVG